MWNGSERSRLKGEIRLWKNVVNFEKILLVEKMIRQLENSELGVLGLW